MPVSRALNRRTVTFSIARILLVVLISLPPSFAWIPSNNFVANVTEIPMESSDSPVGCVCGIFVRKDSERRKMEHSIEFPVIEFDIPEITDPCGAKGFTKCLKHCMHNIQKHKREAKNILCSTLNREVDRERAYLFIKNCKGKWISAHLPGSKEFCCSKGQPLEC